jgi:hypothetical protein
MAVRIDGPSAGSVFVFGDEGEKQAITLTASITGGVLDRSRVREVEFVVDGEVIGRSRAPFRADYVLSRGDHELVVRPVSAGLPVRIATSTFSVR